MKVYVVKRGELYGSTYLVGVYANEDDAKACVKELELDECFSWCDWAAYSEEEVR